MDRGFQQEVVDVNLYIYIYINIYIYRERERERQRERSIHVSMFSDMSNMGLETRNNRNLAYCFEDPMTPLFRLNMQKACDVEWLEI